MIMERRSLDDDDDADDANSAIVASFQDKKWRQVEFPYGVICAQFVMELHCIGEFTTGQGTSLVMKCFIVLVYAMN